MRVVGRGVGGFDGGLTEFLDGEEVTGFIGAGVGGLVVEMVGRPVGEGVGTSVGTTEEGGAVQSFATRNDVLFEIMLYGGGEPVNRARTDT